MTHDLGPLPKGDRQDALQQLSIKAFRNLLPEDQFLFRDERVDDKGVDGALEVKVGGSFTNCRAQVQLKSTDADPVEPKAFNTDGSYSETIATANLNYLLNGPSPLYVIWLSKLDQVRYAWAHDVWRDLDAGKPGWKAQGTFTIRFSKVLTAADLPAVRDRILDEAQMHRRIHESLARSAPAEDVVVSINAETLASSDPNELRERLSKNGMTIVSSGFGKQALEWYALLNPEAAKEPRLKLVAAFAAASIGMYHEAKGYLAAAVAGRGELSEDDRQFLEYLGGACDYHTGRIDRAAYIKLEEEWATRLTGVRAAEHRLEVLRHERFTARKPEHRAELLEHMQGLLADIETNPDTHPPQKIQARLILLSAEGDDLNAQFIEDLAKIGMRQNMGYSSGAMAAAAAKQGEERWAEWEQRAAKLRDDAGEAGHSLLIADAITARVTLYVTFLLLGRMNSLGQGADNKPAGPIVDGLSREAETAITLYRMAGSLSGEFQVKMLLAELHHVCGDDEAAKALAKEVLPVARAMNYARVVDLAQRHLEDRTELRQFSAALAAKEAEHEDFYALAQTDDDIRGMAKMTQETLGIPASRLPFVERDLFAGRVIAEERRDWCRHLELLQDLTHLQRLDTAYQIDPERACVCKKLNHKSKLPHADCNLVIKAFIEAYCVGCPHRNPNRPAGKTSH